MGTRVKFDVEANTGKAIEAFLSLSEAEQKAELAAKKLGMTGKRAGAGFMSSMESAALKVVGVTSAIDLASKAVNVLKQEWKDMIELQDKAAAKITGVGGIAQERKGAIMNLPSDISAIQLDDMVGRIASESKMPINKVFNMMKSGLSAKGDVGVEAFESAMTLSADISQTAGLDAPQLAGGLLDLVQATGLEDAKANMGWMKQVGSQARVTDLGSLVKNLMPAIVGAQAQGDTAEQAAEWATWMSGITLDETGEKTKTGLLAMSGRLKGQALNPVKKGKKWEWELLPEELKNTEERVKFMEQRYAEVPRDIQAEMITKLGGEETTKMATTALLSGDKRAWGKYERIKGEISAPGPESAAGWDEVERATDASPWQTSEDIKNTFESAIDEMLAANTKGSDASNVRKLLGEAMQAAGVGFTERNLQRLGWEVETLGGTKDPLGAGIGRLEGLVSPSEMQATLASGSKSTFAGSIAARVAGATDASETLDPGALGIIEKLIDELKALQDKQEAMRKATEANTAALATSGGRPRNEV